MHRHQDAVAVKAAWLSLTVVACSSSSAPAGGNPSPTEEAGADSGRSSDDSGTGADAPANDAGGNANLPSVTDCTTASGFCIAAAVVRNGMPLTCTATSSNGSVARVAVGTPSWGITCITQSQELTATVNFPIQSPGPINLSSATGTSGFTFSVGPFNLASGATTGSMTETSTNLVSGTLTGTIASNNMATATLTASWGAPGAGCMSGDAPNPCAQGAIKMTFHVSLP